MLAILPVGDEAHGAVPAFAVGVLEEAALGRKGVGGGSGGDAGVVDEDVDGAPLVHDAGDAGGDGVVVRYVKCDADGFAAGGADVVGDFVGAFLKRSLTAMRTPSAASVRAISAPMPRPAPVMRAVRPSMPRSMRTSYDVVRTR
jgi:hypothetical protein